jgi:hypothetical protein
MVVAIAGGIAVLAGVCAADQRPAGVRQGGLLRVRLSHAEDDLDVVPLESHLRRHPHPTGQNHRDALPGQKLRQGMAIVGHGGNYLLGGYAPLLIDIDQHELPGLAEVLRQAPLVYRYSVSQFKTPFFICSLLALSKLGQMLFDTLGFSLELFKILFQVGYLLFSGEKPPHTMAAMMVMGIAIVPVVKMRPRLKPAKAVVSVSFLMHFLPPFYLFSSLSKICMPSSGASGRASPGWSW